jgi:hypothetical protein
LSSLTGIDTEVHPRTVLVLADRVGVALPACRALARYGHRVGVAISTETSSILASRTVSYRHRFPGPSAPQPNWDMALGGAVAERAYDVVLACNDVDVVRLMATEHVVARAPAISTSQEGVLDKAALAGLCADVGVRYPRTGVPAARADDAAVAQIFEGRAAVKAARPAAMTDRGVVHMSGMTAATGHRAVVSAIEHYRNGGLQPIVQEHIEGPKLQAALIRRAGVTTCRLVALVELGTPGEATLRQLDSSAGVGADSITALERVADRVGYEGLLQAEFLVERSGQPCLIDVNPRLWGGLSFAELIGLEMTERVVLDALGLAAPSAPPEIVGRRYHHLGREITYVARSPGRLPAVLSRLGRHDLWDTPPINDIRPFLVQSWQRLRHSAGRSRV